MGIYKPKRILESPDYGYGVCLWQFPDGGYLMDSEGNHFSAQAKMNDPGTELKMRMAVGEMGVTEGRPIWLPGFRQVTEMEWEDQMERLIEGHIPDLVDLYRQKHEGGI